MPRPATKAQLLAQSEANLQRLLDHIEQLPHGKSSQDFPPGTLNRNIRDVLAHLHHWHLMLMEWYEVGMRGDKPHLPAEGYTWKTLPALNQKIQAKYHDMPLTEAKRLLLLSHGQVMDKVRGHTDQELFEKKRYRWTGTTSLGAYLISATSSHYDWAWKLVRKCLK